MSHGRAVHLRFIPTFGGVHSEPAVSGGLWVAPHAHYGLVYQYWPDNVERFPQYTQEWLRRLFTAATPGGIVCIDVPRSQFSGDARRVILSTFERVARPAIVRHDMVVGPFGECVRLQASLSDSEDLIAAGERRTDGGNIAGGPIHSLRRDQLTFNIAASPRAPGPANPVPGIGSH